MYVSCVDSVVHSCFQLRSALSESSWIRRYIRATYYYYYYYDYYYDCFFVLFLVPFSLEVVGNCQICCLVSFICVCVCVGECMACSVVNETSTVMYCTVLTGLPCFVFFSFSHGDAEYVRYASFAFLSFIVGQIGFER